MRSRISSSSGNILHAEQEQVTPEKIEGSMEGESAAFILVPKVPRSRHGKVRDAHHSLSLTMGAPMICGVHLWPLEVCLASRVSTPSKEELELMEWIKKVDINLIMSNATVEFAGKDHSNDLVDMIESIGFEADLDTVVELQATPVPTLQRRAENHEETQLAPRRTVDIKISGMFCPRCPERILRFMDNFVERGVTIDKHLSITQPILKITYTPEAPEFHYQTNYFGFGRS